MAACLGLSGCGGGSDQFSGSAFEGNYQGTFTSNNSGDYGSVSMSVDRDGNARGTLVNNGVSPSSTQDLQGTIQDNGDFNGDLAGSSNDYPFAGNLGFDTNGDLSGPVNIRISNSSSVHAEFVLTYVNRSKKFGKRQAPTLTKSSGKPLL